MHFENAKYRVFHQRVNITAPFPEHLNFQEKLNSTHSHMLKSGKTNKTIIRILYISKMLYTGCSTFTHSL